jgi:hypothetical protein
MKRLLEVCVQFDRIWMLMLIDRQTGRQDIRRIESRIDIEQLGIRISTAGGKASGGISHAIHCMIA